MSLNEFLKEDIPVEAIIAASMIAIIGIFIITPLAIFFAYRKEREIYGEKSVGEIQIQDNVKVISKSHIPHPRNNSHKVNIIMFEFKNKERLEFAIKDNITYEKILVGDIGTLHFCSKKLISFQCT